MNRIDQLIASYDEQDADQYEEDEAPVDEDPQAYPKDLPVKLLQMKEWALKSGAFDTSSYVKRDVDGFWTYDFAGYVVSCSPKYDFVWEPGSNRASQVRPRPSPGIARSTFVIEIPDAAQSLLGLDDAEAQLLFYGERVDGNEDADLSMAFLDHLIIRMSSVFPAVHMTAEDVEDFRRQWSAENAIADPEAAWEEGQVSPIAFAS